MYRQGDRVIILRGRPSERRGRWAPRRKRSKSPLPAEETRSSGALVRKDPLGYLVRLGREVERRVLARAVRWYFQDWVLVDGNRIVVFE